MGEDDAIYAVMSALVEHVKSPSLRHIRGPHMLQKLARDIVRQLYRRSRVWQKWEGERKPFLKAAACCWIPIEDLRTFLNEMPGPSLTMTDVTERLRAFHEEAYEPYPNAELEAGCLALYAKGKAEGTELPAIAGALRDFIEREEERLNRERQTAWKARAEAEKAALEQRCSPVPTVNRRLSRAQSARTAGSTVAATPCRQRRTSAGICIASPRSTTRAFWSAATLSAATSPRCSCRSPTSRNSKPTFGSLTATPVIAP